jgi:hypothetical protein
LNSKNHNFSLRILRIIPLENGKKCGNILVGEIEE